MNVEVPLGGLLFGMFMLGLVCGVALCFFLVAAGVIEKIGLGE